MMLHALSLVDESWTIDHQIDPACDFLLSPSATGIFSNPNYPNVYPKNKVCRWTIRLSAYETISLEFPTFDVQAGSKENSCDQDFIEVVEGYSFHRGRFCNSFRPPGSLLSASNVLQVIFKSNGDEKNGRFQIKYEKRPCGGQFWGVEGVIQSPNYPHPYPTREKCTWQITVPNGKVIKLTFDTFDLNKDSKCELDYLIVRDGPNVTSTELGHFCYEQPPDHTIRSVGQTISLEFHSYSDGNGMGFKAHYEAVSQCGGLLTRDSGRFTSPGFATSQVLSKQDCIWSIKVSPGKVIALTFESLDIGSTHHGGDSCDTDYVAVYDVQDLGSKLHKKVCASLSDPLNLISQGRELRVEMHLSSPHIGQGFFASYYSVSADNPYIGCFIMANEVLFTCDNGRIVHCKWKCDGTDECGDHSDENNCPAQASKTDNQLRNYVTIILSVTASAVGTVCIGCAIDRIRRKRRMYSRRRRTRRFRRSRMSDTVPLASAPEPSSPPPPYECTAPSDAGVLGLSSSPQNDDVQEVDTMSAENPVISTTNINPVVLEDVPNDTGVIETDVQV